MNVRAVDIISTLYARYTPRYYAAVRCEFCSRAGRSQSTSGRTRNLRTTDKPTGTRFCAVRPRTLFSFGVHRVGNLVYWHMRIGQAATIGHALASDIHQPIKRRAYSVNNRTVVQLALTASHPPGTGVRLFNDAAVLL